MRLRGGGKGKYGERDGKIEREGKMRGQKGKSRDGQTSWAAKRTEMGDLQMEPERQRRNRAGGDREKPVGVETQGTREEKVRNRMRKGPPWRPSG